MLLAASLAGCTHVNGWFEGHSTEGEDWRMVPDRCFTGERLMFNGVELESSGAEPHSVMVLADPVRPSVVVVASSTHERVVFDASNCAPVEPHVYTNAERIHGFRTVSGSITVACTDGDHVLRGTVAFDGCH